jgi:Putative zinc-finger
MSEREQNTGKPGRVLRCDEWENLLVDALDGRLTAADQAAFNRHHSECTLCAQMLKETQQGKAWLQYLTAEPEPPADLLKNILARTSGRSLPGVVTGMEPGLPAPAPTARPAWRRVAPRVFPVVRQALEPRLLMTAAMAFFSIALTLNLTGIKISEIRASDLTPSRLRATATRQFYSTNEQVMKYYANLRLVYEMEARVRELRRSTEAEPTPAPREAPKRTPRDGTGTPSSTVPSKPPVLKGSPLEREQQPVVPMAASFDRAGRTKVRREVFRALRSTTEDQAERSLV